MANSAVCSLSLQVGGDTGVDEGRRQWLLSCLSLNPSFWDCQFEQQEQNISPYSQRWPSAVQPHTKAAQSLALGISNAGPGGVC